MAQVSRSYGLHAKLVVIWFTKNLAFYPIIF